MRRAGGGALVSRSVPRAVQARYCICGHHQDVHRHGGACDATAGTGGYCACERFDSQVPVARPAYVPTPGLAPDYRKATPCKWKP
jgi:hypothetical protein